MEDRYAQDLVKGASILLAEGAAYPISSVVTRAQSLYINPMVVEKPFSSFNAISSVLTAVPVHILKVKCASVFHSELTQKYSLSSIQAAITITALTDVIGCFIRAPAEYYRQQFQVGSYTSFKRLLNDTLGYHGPLGIMRGYSVYLLRELSFNTLRLLFLHSLQQQHIKNNSRKRRSYAQMFEDSMNDERSQNKKIIAEMKRHTWFNILATIPAAILSTPFDVIKTRIMTHPPSEERISALGHFKSIIREEGARVLFRGAGMRCLHICTILSLYLSLEFYLSYPLEEARRIREKMKNMENVID